MVETRSNHGISSEALRRASNAIADALAEGVDAHELQDMVTTVAAQQAAEQPELPGPFSDLIDQEPIYTETNVPEGLIDLRAAATKYGFSVHTLRLWVRKGTLQTHGRLRSPAPGGGVYLVAERQLESLNKLPPARGRPPRSKSH